MNGDILWLFGVGLSIDCGLRWGVPELPEHCRELRRDKKIQCIREELGAAMGAPGVNPEPIRHFLQFLSERTRDGWRHRFLTTNWDFLLQSEINKFVPDVVPRWLRDSHVFHLNGTIEVLDDNSRRSAFVLPEDRARTPSLEFNMALSDMEWGRTFVVVGMRLECEADRALFNLLNKVKEMRPSGESDWIIVNPCQAALDSSRDLIGLKLSQASVKTVRTTFTCCQEALLRQLNGKGIFS